MRIILTIALLIVTIGLAVGVDMGEVEMRPGEAFMERLFERGIGEPWVGGNPPWEQNQAVQTLVLPIKRDVARRLQYYPIGMAYSNGYLVIGEGPGAMMIPYPAGTYRVLGCYDQGRQLVGVYIDLAGNYPPWV